MKGCGASADAFVQAMMTETGSTTGWAMSI
jgi:hypothetical protein